MPCIRGIEGVSDGRNDLILLTIGDMTERSLLMRHGLPRDVSIDELWQRAQWAM